MTEESGSPVNSVFFLRWFLLFDHVRCKKIYQVNAIMFQVQILVTQTVIYLLSFEELFWNCIIFHNSIGGFEEFRAWVVNICWSFRYVFEEILFFRLKNYYWTSLTLYNLELKNLWSYWGCLSPENWIGTLTFSRCLY